ncbi:MAG: hypothetical protein WC314_24530 [Vulcanimicrobiota bacterium]
MKRFLIVLFILMAVGCKSDTVEQSIVAATPSPTEATYSQAVPVNSEPVVAEAEAAYEYESEYEQPDFQDDGSSYAPPPQSQADPRLPELARMTTEMALGVAQQRLSLSQNMIGMARQIGDLQNLQLCQAEYQMHQLMIAQLQGILSDPSSFESEAGRQEISALLNEYNYRSDTRDMRPADQIQAKLAEYVAYQSWKAGTPEGRQAHQANMDSIRAQGEARTARHNQNMANMQAQADARNAAWSAEQQANYEQHQRNTHAIYNEYQYNDPNTGQGYWVPMENQNPAVINPDGTYTELEPY